MQNILSPKVAQAAQNLANRIKCGELVDVEELEIVNLYLNNALPDWYIYLLSQYPLADAPLNSSLLDDDKGVYLPNNTQVFLNEYQLNPCLHFKEKGYFLFGLNAKSTVSLFMLHQDEGLDPPVYEAFHEELEVVKRASSLSTFLDSLEYDDTTPSHLLI